MKNDNLLEATINELNNIYDDGFVHLQFPFWCIAVFTTGSIGYGKYTFEGYLTKPYRVSGETFLGTARRVESNDMEHLDSALNYIKKFKTEIACNKHIQKLEDEFIINEFKPVYVECLQDLGTQNYDIK